jgi:Tfp pilus tip-associated adhesin PilY1
MDMALNVLFQFFDRDGSLAALECTDSEKLWDGASSVISCKDYMNTPFRDVRRIVTDSGGTASDRLLPLAGGGSTQDRKLANQLTDADADLLGARVRSMTYSGAGRWAGCTATNTFRLDQGGFAGGSNLDLQRHWSFFRGERAEGGTPLAYILGLDDNSASNSTIGNDALNAFRVELQSDPSIECRTEFAIVITDGEDTCAGDGQGATSGQTSGSATTNANRRSSIQAVSNLRTHYVRNPVQNRGKTYKKEIITFVIGIGVTDPVAIRTLNAMALAGGTHTKGIIRHVDPNGKLVGTVDIDDVIPSGSPSLLVFKNLGIAAGLDTSPNNAHLKGCGINSSERKETGGFCKLGGVNIFDDAFFATGSPFPAGQELSDFAFITHTPDELVKALNDILGFVQAFSTSGVAPSAPQSSTSVALRDRVFLSLLTPITDKRMWQGRLALYGFVDDPDNPGSKLVVAKPSGSAGANPKARTIFNPDGTLNDFAKQFYWEAGKLLAERDLSSKPRKLLAVSTTESDSVAVERDQDGKLLSIRYTGGVMEFKGSNFDPIDFGITDADVADDTLFGLCTSVCPGGTGKVCEDRAAEGCKTCVKGCLKDRIVNFLSGNTRILPVPDPMGKLGVDCPDQEAQFDSGGNLIDSGSFATCSVRLGDIFHSTPKVVGSPSPLFFDVGFQNFAVNFRDRTGVVYVGANDGFLHAFHAGSFVNATPADPKVNPFTGKSEIVPFFDEGTGEELFAFTSPTFRESTRGIPFPINPPYTNPTEYPSSTSGPDYRYGDLRNFVLPEVAYQRSWFDGSPLVADVWIDGLPNGITDSNSKVPCTSGVVGDPDGVIDECGKEWHTMLFTTPRNGGGIITALDVTNVDATRPGQKKLSEGPDYPSHYWTLFDRNFGNMWSDPTIGRVRMQTKKGGETIVVDRWVMFIAGGVHPTVVNPLEVKNTDIGNAFYVIDIATGKTIFKYARNASTAPNATVTDEDMVCDLPGSVSAIDINGDGYIDLVYAGDRCGRLWRFDVSMPFIDEGGDVSETGMGGDATFTTIDSSGESVWRGGIAFCANTAANCRAENHFVPARITDGLHQIFFPPTVVLDDLGRRHVIFLTGNRREPSNIDDYGVLVSFIDPFVPAFLRGGVHDTPPPVRNFGYFSSGQIITLTPQGSSGTTLGTQFTTTGGTAIGDSGEFMIRFPNNVPTPSGEKGFGTPVVINRVLIWTTFAPNVDLTNPCSDVSGVGRIFAVDYLTGQPALARIPGAEPLIEGSQAQKALASGKTVATGMPTPSQLSFGARGSVVLVVAFSGSASVGSSQFLVWELPPFPTRTQTLFWEEVF